MPELNLVLIGKKLIIRRIDDVESSNRAARTEVVASLRGVVPVQAVTDLVASLPRPPLPEAQNPSPVPNPTSSSSSTVTTTQVTAPVITDNAPVETVESLLKKQNEMLRALLKSSSPTHSGLKKTGSQSGEPARKDLTSAFVSDEEELLDMSMTPSPPNPTFSHFEQDQFGKS